MKIRLSGKGERRSGEKDLDLPARSRFGEGRAATFNRFNSGVANHMEVFDLEPTMDPHT